MSARPLIWIVGINCRAVDEAKFNAWYDDVHVPMLMKGGFVKRAARFKQAPQTYHVGATTETCPTYLTIYEFEDQAQFDAWMTSPVRAEAGDDKTKTWSENPYELRWATRFDRVNAWN